MAIVTDKVYGLTGEQLQDLPKKVKSVATSTAEAAVASVDTKVEGALTDIESLKTNKLDKSAVKQAGGESTTDVMSQKAITDLLDEKADYSGLSEVAVSGSYNDLEDLPTIPTTAAEVHALADTTKYGATLDMTMDDKTYVVTVTLKDQNGATLGEAKTIDLPLESVVVSGSYDKATKEVKLELKDGSEVKFSVADLVSGLQTELSADNQLSADFIKDGSTNKAYTATEKTKLSGIEEGAQKNVKADWDAQTGDAQILNKPTIPSNTNQLENGAGFITKSVADLTNYTTTTELNSRLAQIESEISGAGVEEMTPAEWSALWA